METVQRASDGTMSWVQGAFVDKGLGKQDDFSREALKTVECVCVCVCVAFLRTGGT